MPVRAVVVGAAALFASAPSHIAPPGTMGPRSPVVEVALSTSFLQSLEQEAAIIVGRRLASNNQLELLGSAKLYLEKLVRESSEDEAIGIVARRHGHDLMCCCNVTNKVEVAKEVPLACNGFEVKYSYESGGCPYGYAQFHTLPLIRLTPVSQTLFLDKYIYSRGTQLPVSFGEDFVAKHARGCLVDIVASSQRDPPDAFPFGATKTTGPLYSRFQEANEATVVRGGLVSQYRGSLQQGTVFGYEAPSSGDQSQDALLQSAKQSLEESTGTGETIDFPNALENVLADHGSTGLCCCTGDSNGSTVCAFFVATEATHLRDCPTVTAVINASDGTLPQGLYYDFLGLALEEENKSFSRRTLKDIDLVAMSSQCFANRVAGLHPSRRDRAMHDNEVDRATHANVDELTRKHLANGYNVCRSDSNCNASVATEMIGPDGSAVSGIRTARCVGGMCALSPESGMHEDPADRAVTLQMIEEDKAKLAEDTKKAAEAQAAADKLDQQAAEVEELEQPESE